MKYKKIIIEIFNILGIYNILYLYILILIFYIKINNTRDHNIWYRYITLRENIQYIIYLYISIDNIGTSSNTLEQTCMIQYNLLTHI